MKYRVGSEKRKKRNFFFSRLFLKKMSNTKTINELKKLLFLFCVNLYGTGRNINPRQDYYEIVYQVKEWQSTNYDEDVEYLIQYQKKHGCYPAKFQELFSEWLLRERL